MVLKCHFYGIIQMEHFILSIKHNKGESVVLLWQSNTIVVQLNYNGITDCGIGMGNVLHVVWCRILWYGIGNVVW